MWQLVACRSYFNYKTDVLPRKRLFDSYCLILVLLAFIFLSTIKASRVYKKDPESDGILCRRCGSEIATAKDIINHLSPEAVVLPNQTLFERKGVEVQVLKNTFNIKFNVISVSKAEDCVPVDKWYIAESWYPGYAWKPCICQKCRTHHGWVFESVEAALLNTPVLSKKAFYLLKLHNTVSEKFTDSLLVVPYSYIK